jgi:hypothetical protein
MSALLLLQLLLALSLSAPPRVAAWTGCSAEEDCLLLPATPRCLPASGPSAGAPCTLDYAFNESGYCACGAQPCVALTSAPAQPSARQLLVVGDSNVLHATDAPAPSAPLSNPMYARARSPPCSRPSRTSAQQDQPRLHRERELGARSRVGGRACA